MKQLWTDPLYRLFVFGAYGTLFQDDFHQIPGLAEATQGEASAKEAYTLWHAKQREYLWVRSLIGRWTNYDVIAEDALAFALSAYGMNSEETQSAFLKTYQSPVLYPDVIPFLEIMKEETMQAAILSDGTHETLELGLNSTQVKGFFDKVISAEDVDMYKPSPLIYRLVQQLMGVQPEEVVYFSANPWDIAGAATAGFTTVWVNRSGAPFDNLHTTPAFTVESLEELI